MKLNRTFATLLMMGVKQFGSYDPDLALCAVEEQMTVEEALTANEFLKWCVENNRTFGHGNIQEVFGEWQCSKGKPNAKAKAT